MCRQLQEDDGGKVYKRKRGEDEDEDDEDEDEDDEDDVGNGQSLPQDEETGSQIDMSVA